LGLNAGSNSQDDNTVAVGNAAGQNTQTSGSVAVGYQAGQTYQGFNAVAIGGLSGRGTQGSGAVAIGYNAASTGQGTNSVSIGTNAGQFTQASGAVAIGFNAGGTLQGQYSIAIGNNAGQNTASSQAIAIGLQAGLQRQGANAVAIGAYAGNYTQASGGVAIGLQAGQTSQAVNGVAVGVLCGSISQGQGSVAIGSAAGQTQQYAGAISVGNVAGRFYQGSNAIAIGYQAGYYTQGSAAIAIGFNAGVTNQTANSIIINASGSIVNPTTSGTYINPILSTTNTGNYLVYNTTSSEINYSTTGLPAATVSQTGTSTSANYYPLFSSVNTTGTGNTIYVDNGASPLTYNPGTDTLTATNFVGSLSGASSSTNAINPFISTFNTTNYLVFSDSTIATSTPWVTTNLTINPVTGAFGLGGTTCGITVNDRTTATNQLSLFSTGNTVKLQQKVSGTTASILEGTTTTVRLTGDTTVWPTASGGNGGIFLRDRTTNTLGFGWYSDANSLNYYNLANGSVGSMSPTGRMVMNAGFQGPYQTVNGIVGGGMDLTYTGSFSGAGVYNIDSIFTTNYSSYRIILYITSVANANQSISLDLIQSGSVDTTLNYYYSKQLAGSDSWFSGVNGWLLNSNLGTSSGTGTTSNVTYTIFEIMNPAQSGYTFLTSNHLCNNNGQSELINGQYRASKAFTGLQFGNASTTIVGTIRVYGIN
jgi:hypothetical protein